MEASETRFLGDTCAWTPYPDGVSDTCLPLYDGDSRRWFSLKLVRVDSKTQASLRSADYVATWAPIHRALAAEIDGGLALEVTAVVMTADGNILAKLNDTEHDCTPGTHYASPADYQLPGCVDTISRLELAEVKRLGPLVDVVAPVSAPSERFVFKHYEDGDAIYRMWHDVQIPARMSPYPNIVPIRHLVVHEKIDGSDSSAAVVGFTMPFIPGSSLQATRTTRIFKLKWAKQLFDVIDDLNLKYGIVHGDVRLRNLMVDPATDNLVLIDFGLAAKRTEQQYRKAGTYIPPVARAEVLFGPDFGLFGPPETKSETQQELVVPLAPPKQDNPDVVAATVTVHELVTSNPTDDLWATDNDQGNLWNGVGIDGIIESPWTAHPDALLDSPAEDFHAALADWLKRREADPRDGVGRTSASTPLDFPNDMPVPSAEEVPVDGYKHPLDVGVPSFGGSQNIPVKGYKFYRRDAVRAGRSIVSWVRPTTAALDGNRKLLVTGKYVDEVERGRKRKALHQRVESEHENIARRRSPRLSGVTVRNEGT